MNNNKNDHDPAWYDFVLNPNFSNFMARFHRQGLDYARIRP